MARREKMSHTGFHERAAKARSQYRILSIKENVQSSWGFEPSGESITRQWINSSGHRENLLARSPLAGIGIAKQGKRVHSTLLIGDNRPSPSSPRSGIYIPDMW
jgi:uncharacterized protein YkwD